eukprot:CAMPEP_0198597656 /NCGR_PEP_ID=MMETSP1462-20131121/144701_1 /TAXON_ID=1333877 /ORGANISM="Brandtodinium nutriculum, Strain RCC3387" /LENGTH=233 /DNA_ID=CAMNT_0044329321 /DNA_START=23 /DNA_END=720 /DNA_ORIENTATION=+
MKAIGLAAIVMAIVGTLSDIAAQAIITNRGAGLASAYTAVRVSFAWIMGMFTFLFLGPMTLIGTSAGAGDVEGAGIFARMAIFSAVVAGLLGAGIIPQVDEGILGLFGQTEVTEKGATMFAIMAYAFPLGVLIDALVGISIGLMYVHIVVLQVIAAAVVALAVGLPLFVGTALELTAFGISAVAAECVTVAGLSAYLLTPDRRRRYGFLKMFSGITAEKFKAFGAGFGVLAVR